DSPGERCTRCTTTARSRPSTCATSWRAWASTRAAWTDVRAPAAGRARAHLLALALAAGALPALAPGSGVAAETPAPLARLELLDHGQGPEAWARNELAGPIEVVLRAEGPAPRAVPALPARATVPARGEVLLSRLGGTTAGLVL